VLEAGVEQRVKTEHIGVHHFDHGTYRHYVFINIQI